MRFTLRSDAEFLVPRLVEGEGLTVCVVAFGMMGVSIGVGVIGTCPLELILFSLLGTVIISLF